jgi:hypothetical protein
MLGLISGAAAYSSPRPGSFAAAIPLPGSARRAAASDLRMDSAEAAARRRWLEQRARDAPVRPAPRVSPEEEEAMRKAARMRMLGAMGGADKIKSGAGVAFGFGAADDEDYGYGPPKEPDPRAELYTEDVEGPLPSWMTTDPVGAQDYLRKMDEGYIKGESAMGAGFDGRPLEWRRTTEAENPNPPPMADTLREPAPYAASAQSFAMDFQSARADIVRADEAEAAQREEDELLGTLLGKTPEELHEEERKRLEREARGRPWNSD